MQPCGHQPPNAAVATHKAVSIREPCAAQATTLVGNSDSADTRRALTGTVTDLNANQAGRVDAAATTWIIRGPGTRLGSETERRPRPDARQARRALRRGATAARRIPSRATRLTIGSEPQAPPGALGLVFDVSAPRVMGVRAWSPLAGSVTLGDVLTAVNGVCVDDASGFDAASLVKSEDDGATPRALTFFG